MHICEYESGERIFQTGHQFLQASVAMHLFSCTRQPGAGGVPGYSQVFTAKPAEILGYLLQLTRDGEAAAQSYFLFGAFDSLFLSS